MGKLLKSILVAIAVDFVLFPVSFTFIPLNINSKVIMAFFGMAAFVYKCLNEKSVIFAKRTAITAILAVVFSIWCYFSVTYNGTDDTTYATYWTSFFAWLSSAYGAYTLMKAVEDKGDLGNITKYLLIVCVAQCIIAILIDNFPIIDTLISKVFWQASDYYRRIDRLYGIGCALDPAGVRFAAVLLLAGHQIAYNESMKMKRSTLVYYLLGFIILTIIGSMIARTTTIGAVIAVCYFIFINASIKRGGNITNRQLWFFALLIGLVLTSIVVASGLYNSSDEARNLFRFGFEGFFNLFETGEFRTHSTDILMENMWKWPSDWRGWVIGYGRYGVFSWGTDIGYCNFTLYCGLIGLALFSAYFIYVNMSMNTKFKNFYLISLLLITLQAIIWAKVATDIFVIDAFLLCIDGDYLEESPDESPQEE